MKKIAAVTLVTLLAVGTAAAADLRPRPMPVKAAPVPVATMYSWTGCYIGGHIGYAWGRKKDSSFGGDLLPEVDHDVDGFIAGGQVGCNLWQSDRFVFGVEGQAAWANVDGRSIVDDGGLETKADILGSIAARFGYAFGATGQTLVFVKGGAAFVHEEHILRPENAVTEKHLRWGWMVGGGFEQALSGGWSMKAEYNYTDFGNKTQSMCVVGSTTCFDFAVKQQMHIVKVGLNYRFGGFGGPVVARY